MNTYKPTRLYVKKHTVTGLRYFGKSVRKNINQYSGSGTYWKNHIKKHGKDHVITEWLSDWFYDEKEIKKFALAFSEIFNIVNSSEWANLKEENGTDGGPMGKLSQEKVAKAVLRTKSDPVWKATTGKKSKEKMLKTKNDALWKATIGKERSKKLSENQNDPLWKATTGKDQVKKMLETKSDPVWKATTGKKCSEKRSKTMNDPEWKKLNSKVCEHCNKVISSANHKRWHGPMCSYKK